MLVAWILPRCDSRRNLLPDQPSQPPGTAYVRRSLGARTDRVVRNAQVNGFRHVQRADRDWRLVYDVQELVRRFSKESDRGDVVGHLERHRLGCHGEACAIRHLVRGDETHHGCALGISTEHHLGIGAARRHALDLSARVGTKEIRDAMRLHISICHRAITTARYALVADCRAARDCGAALRKSSRRSPARGRNQPAGKSV